MAAQVCQNCGATYPADQKLPAVKDLAERVAPGEPMPSGECPQCGALCQPLQDAAKARPDLLAACEWIASVAHRAANGGLKLPDKADRIGDHKALWRQVRERAEAAIARARPATPDSAVEAGLPGQNPPLDDVQNTGPDACTPCNGFGVGPDGRDCPACEGTGTRLKPFTVVGLYPDTVNYPSPRDGSWIEHVNATDSGAAADAALRQLAAGAGTDDDGTPLLDPDDLAVVATFPGHLQDLSACGD